MTQNKETYRFKGRAIFLAAIMVISVLAMPLAFAGGAAAAPSISDEPHDRVVDAGDQGERIFQGQITIFETANTNFDDAEDVDLFTTTRDSSGDRILDEFISVEDVTEDDAGNYTVVDTDELDSGSYALSAGIEGDDVNDSDDIRFTITEQTINAEFDDETVTTEGGDSDTEFEVSSRQRNTYAINVSADGLDADELSEIFNQSADIGPDRTDDPKAQNRSSIAAAAGMDGYALDDDEDVLTIFDGEQVFDVDFNGIDDDEYEFDVDVVDSTASASDSVTVEDRGDGELSVEDVEQEQGDIAAITVSADNADAGTLVIGEEDDVGYQANISITEFNDDNEAVIYFNTYLAGTDEDSDLIIFTDDDADEEIDFDSTDNQTTSIDGILDVGSYELTVSSVTSTNADGEDRFEQTIDSPDEVATLFIEERSTDNWNIWTSSADAAGDIADEDADDRPDAVAQAIEDGLITDTDSVAHDDVMIHQVEASGLTGALKAMDQNNDKDALAELLLNAETNIDGTDYDVADLRIRETRDSVGPNANRQRLNLTETFASNDVEVVVDDENNQFFVIMPTDDIRVGDGAALDDKEEYEFDIRFELRDPRLLDVDEDDLDDFEDQFDRLDLEPPVSIEEREGEFDVSSDDMIEVTDEEGQLVTGTTNIAPGSEVSIRLRGQSGASFSKSASDFVVSSDGTFEGEFDFSDRSVDDEFEATLRNAGIDDRPEADGIVVEAVDEVDDDEMDDEADDEMDDHDDMDDQEVDDHDDEVDETEDDTPGFGALIALVAVLGAALLAVRRQN